MWPPLSLSFHTYKISVQTDNNVVWFSINNKHILASELRLWCVECAARPEKICSSWGNMSQQRNLIWSQFKAPKIGSTDFIFLARPDQANNCNSFHLGYLRFLTSFHNYHCFYFMILGMGTYQQVIRANAQFATILQWHRFLVRMDSCCLGMEVNRFSSHREKQLFHSTTPIDEVQSTSLIRKV